MTFSLLGADPVTGEVGMVVTSSSPAVAARCAFARAGVGVASTQNVTDPRLGPVMLDTLAAGGGPEAALQAAQTAAAPHAEHRQLAVLAADGRGIAWSGAHALGVHGTRVGVGCVAAGNLLADASVLDAILSGFDADPAAGLAERLLAGLRAGLAAGGEAGPLASAGLLVCGDVPWPEVDLRVDHDDDPVGALERLYARFAPQRADYVTRALDPTAAPSYGVPGDE